ncbi:MAG TPA: TolC family protein [Verrucomicrobiae bacterium]|nr:TolC family protein [Verrucomicrobiae bacterium]
MKRALAIVALVLAGWVNGGHSAPAETNIPVTLSEGFQKVLAHDPELLRLRKDVERATGTKLVFHARDLAQFGVQPTVGLEGGSLYGNHSKFALVTAQFSQPLLNAAIAPNWRRGNLEVLATEQNLNAAIAGRLHEFRIYYIRAQRLQQLIALYEEIDRRLQTNVLAEQQRREAGTTGPRPLLQAKVQLLSERAELTGFRREDFEVRSAMAEMMGQSPERLPLPTEPLAREKVNMDLKADTEAAERQRADLKFLRALIGMAKEDERVVGADYFPYVSAIASSLYIPGKRPVYQATPIIEGQQPLGTDYRGGVNLTWQIIDNGRVTGVRRQIKGLREEYAIVLGQLQENIPRELERISHSLENADAKLNALEKSTTEADQGLKLIETRISLGEATQLDFSNAQRDLLSVRHGIVDALFQQAWAKADLDRVTGTYLEFAERVKGP